MFEISKLLKIGFMVSLQSMQELIIGPIAWSEARKVSGISIVGQIGEVMLEGDKRQTIDALVARYDRLFGRASHEVSREAVLGLLADLAPDDVPMSLKE